MIDTTKAWNKVWRNALVEFTHEGKTLTGRAVLLYNDYLLVNHGGRPYKVNAENYITHY